MGPKLAGFQRQPISGQILYISNFRTKIYRLGNPIAGTKHGKLSNKRESACLTVVAANNRNLPGKPNKDRAFISLYPLIIFPINYAMLQQTVTGFR